MKTLLQKMREAADLITREKGGLTLFALLQPEGYPPTHWDVVVAAPWIDEDRIDTLRYLVTTVYGCAGGQGQAETIARVVPLDSTDPKLVELVEQFAQERLPATVRDTDFLALTIKRGWVIVASADLARPALALAEA